MNALGSAIGTSPVPIALIAFRFLEPKTPPKPHKRGLGAGAVKQGADTALVFSRRAAADNRGNLRGITVAGKFGPFTIFQAGDDAPGDFLLCVPGVHTPDPVGIFNLDLVVDDVDPYGLVGSTFNHNAVPSGKLQLGGETAAEIAVAEPFNGIKSGAQALHLASSRNPA